MRRGSVGAAGAAALVQPLGRAGGFAFRLHACSAVRSPACLPPSWLAVVPPPARHGDFPSAVELPPCQGGTIQLELWLNH